MSAGRFNHCMQATPDSALLRIVANDDENYITDTNRW